MKSFSMFYNRWFYVNNVWVYYSFWLLNNYFWPFYEFSGFFYWNKIDSILWVYLDQIFFQLIYLQTIVNLFFPLTCYWIITVFFSKSSLTIIVFITKVSKFFDCHLFIALALSSLYIFIYREQKVLYRLINFMKKIEIRSSL